MIDITLLSDVQEYKEDYVSKAQVLILSATFEGTQLGGGVECHQCPVGYVSNEERSGCEPCQAGQTPSPDQSHCVPCPDNHYKQYEDG